MFFVCLLTAYTNVYIFPGLSWCSQQCSYYCSEFTCLLHKIVLRNL